MSGNFDDYEKQKDNVDIGRWTVAERGESTPQAGKRLVEEVIAVVSGGNEIRFKSDTYK